MKHRKLLSLLSAALLGFSAAVFPPAALKPAELVAKADKFTTKAQYKTPEGLLLNKSGSTLYVVGYTGSNMNVKVPSKYEGMKITALSASAMESISIKTIELPDTIESIGKYAFRYCTELTEIVIPEKVKVLQDRTFFDCKKLKRVEIKGAAKIEEFVFGNCKALENVIMNPGCQRAVSYAGGRAGVLPSDCVFNGCTSLKKINNQKVVQTNSSGKPYLIGDQGIRDIIGKFITRSQNVGFVTSYCSLLCDYIVKTELVAGMSDAIHARQLHDWLVKEFAYAKEGTRYGEAKILTAPEFSTYTGAFLNYGLYGVGEAVCAGYTAAFERLLHSAHLESYKMRSSSADHCWNLVKLDGHWYHIDVTWDDTTGGWGTYTYFMKTGSQMAKLNRTYYDPYVSESVYKSGDADLTAGLNAMNKATHSYTDTNGDGILDGDWNLDGVKNSADTAIKKRLIKMQGQNAVQDSQMSKFVRLLHRERKTPEKFLSDEGY